MQKERSRYHVPESRYKLAVFRLRAPTGGGIEIAYHAAHVACLSRASGTFHGTRPDDLGSAVSISRGEIIRLILPSSPSRLLVEI